MAKKQLLLSHENLEQHIHGSRGHTTVLKKKKPERCLVITIFLANCTQGYFVHYINAIYVKFHFHGDHCPGMSRQVLEFLLCPVKSWNMLEFWYYFGNVLEISWKCPRINNNALLQDHSSDDHNFCHFKIDEIQIEIEIFH